MTDKISIGLTQFIDFSIKQSVSRVNFIKQVKYQDDYKPAFDFWKQLRDSIKTMHENDYPISYLSDLPERVTPKRREKYITAIKHYTKFIQSHKIETFNVGQSFWSFDNLIVRSSPELGLRVDNAPYLIKLYFKGDSEKIIIRNTKIALTLMATSINSLSLSYPPAILDVSKPRLLPLNKVDKSLKLALEADAHNLIYLWNNL